MQDTPTMRVSITCHCNRIYTHLRDGSLDMPVSDYLDYFNGCEKTYALYISEEREISNTTNPLLSADCEDVTTCLSFRLFYPPC